MKRLPLFAAITLLAAAASPAQTAPVGFIAYNFAASGTASTYYLSAPLIAPIVFSGTVTAAGTNTLTVASATWTPGQYAGSTPYYALLTSGSQAGRFLLIKSNTTTQLTVDTTDASSQSTALNSAGFSVSGTDTLEISAGVTMSSFLGSTGTTAFPGSGSSFGTAGGVGLWNAQTLSFDQYYFNTTVSHWVKNGASTATDAGGTVIPPSATIAVFLPAGYAGGTLINAGRAIDVAPLVKVPGGSAVRYLGLVVPVDMTLSQINLGSTWTKSNSIFTADTLSVYDTAAGKWDSYYETTGGTWMKSGSGTSQNATVIPGGSAVAFLKRAAVSGKASLLPVTLPYTP